ncbi:hypothetical protein D9M71_198910 [compost metagenome]
MGALAQGGHGTVGAVVDVAVERLAVFAVVEVAQVGLQAVAATQVGVVGQAQVVLLVDVFQLAVEVAGIQRRAERIGGAAEVQAVAAAFDVRAVEQVHLLAAGRFAATDLGEAPGGESEPVHLTGLQQEAVVGGDQLAGVVVEGYRQHRAVFADLQFGLRITHLAGQRGAAIFVGLLALAVVVGNDAVRATATAAIEAESILSGYIETELHSAFGISGDGAQVETLGPASEARLRRIILFEVTVDIEVAQAKADLPILHEVRLGGYRHEHPHQACGSDAAGQPAVLKHGRDPYYMCTQCTLSGSGSITEKSNFGS